ncbi:MAG TPA: PAS domain-containing protein, partial [Longimicrobiaceae bacterium]|nr:PAS domain-containing protein [Longimicrobiaceae bacterium]
MAGTVTDGTSRIAEAVRDACLEAWRAAFERAFISGLGAEGAAEAALGAVRALDLVPVVTDLAGAPGMSDPSPPQHTGTSEEPARPSGEGLRGPPQLAEIIATHVAEGLCLMDTEGRLTYMNPAAEEILGWRQEEILGRVLHDVVHYLHPDGTPFPWEECPLGAVLRSGVTLRDRE